MVKQDFTQTLLDVIQTHNIINRLESKKTTCEYYNSKELSAIIYSHLHLFIVKNDFLLFSTQRKNKLPHELIKWLLSYEGVSVHCRHRQYHRGWSYTIEFPYDPDNVDIILEIINKLIDTV